MNNNLLRNRFAHVTAFFLLLTVVGCSVFRPGTTSDRSGGSNEERSAPEKASKGDSRFLTSISTDQTDAPGGSDGTAATETPGSGRRDDARAGSGPLYRARKKSSAGNEKTPVATATSPAGPATALSVLQLKYSLLTNTSVEKLDNQRLLEFMDEWYGVPYHFGGTTKRGIDCSAFALTLMENVYGVTDLPRMSRDQYAASAKIPRKKLREGDLVFFHTYGKGKTVTHVGVYLYNDRFVHASVSGVQIDDLDGSYYSRHFVGAGRILE